MNGETTSTTNVLEYRPRAAASILPSGSIVGPVAVLRFGPAIDQTMRRIIDGLQVGDVVRIRVLLGPWRDWREYRIIRVTLLKFWTHQAGAGKLHRSSWWRDFFRGGRIELELVKRAGETAH
jgi:hypothetical protein